jgi:hypothetical protein
MGWLPALIGAGGSLLSGLFGSSHARSQTELERQRLELERQMQAWQRQFAERQFGATQQGNWWDRLTGMLPHFQNSLYGSATRTTGDSTTNSTTTPVITSAYQGLNELAKNIVTSRLSSPFGSLPTNYASSGVRDINKAFEGVNAGLMSGLASKGLSASPLGGGAAASIAGERGSKIADFLSAVPLKEREAQTADIGLANDMTARFGLGSNTLSTTNFTQDSSTSGYQNMLSGVSGFGDGGTMPPDIMSALAAIMGGGIPGMPQFPGMGGGVGTGSPSGIPFPTNMNDLMAYILGSGATPSGNTGVAGPGGGAGVLRNQYA